MKQYYVAQYENTGDERFGINTILDGPEKNMKCWANKTVMDMGYGSMHECEEDAITEISILRIEFLKKEDKLKRRRYKEEVDGLLRWLNYYKKVKPHLFV